MTIFPNMLQMLFTAITVAGYLGYDQYIAVKFKL